MRKVLRKEIILYIALLKTGIIIYKRKEWIQGREREIENCLDQRGRRRATVSVKK